MTPSQGLVLVMVLELVLVLALVLPLLCHASALY